MSWPESPSFRKVGRTLCCDCWWLSWRFFPQDSARRASRLSACLCHDRLRPQSRRYRPGPDRRRHARRVQGRWPRAHDPLRHGVEPFRQRVRRADRKRPVLTAIRRRRDPGGTDRRDCVELARSRPRRGRGCRRFDGPANLRRNRPGSRADPGSGQGHELPDRRVASAARDSGRAAGLLRRRRQGCRQTARRSRRRGGRRRQSLRVPDSLSPRHPQ